MLSIVPKDEAPAPLPDLFDDFWTLYPRHVGKKRARIMWDRINPSLYQQILVAVVQWRPVWLDREDDEYIPHPATWLYGERWDDELPAAYRRRAASHAPAAIPEKGERGQIPEHVAQLLAKLRGKA